MLLIWASECQLLYHCVSISLFMETTSSRSSTVANSLWMSTAPLFGAFIADQYLGRYKTLQWSNVITIVGHFILIISALPRVIVHSLTALIPFLVGVILMGIGFGGIKSVSTYRHLCVATYTRRIGPTLQHSLSSNFQIPNLESPLTGKAAV